MFNQLSDQAKILTSLQALSGPDLALATENLRKQIILLNVDAIELLANRRNYGALLGSAFVNSNIDLLADITLKDLLSSEQHLTNAINTLCLTEAILVRDTFNNALEIIAEFEMRAEVVSSIETETSIMPSYAVNKASTASSSAKQQTKSISASNIAPIHLVDVKQRLSQALHSNVKQHESIKNKLNGVLTSKESISRIKQVI